MAKLKKKTEEKQPKKKTAKKRCGKEQKKKLEEKPKEPEMANLVQNVPEEHSFVLKDGSKINNLMELAEKFETMEEEVYSHHVTEDNNDFANWIRDVMGKNELAENVSKAEHRDKAHIELLKHIVNEKRK